jgi:hypothetical protein
MRLLPRFPRGRAADPGAGWADAVLAPLRRVGAEVDVTGAVMRRVASLAAAPAAEPPRAAWTAAFAFGVTSLAAVVATLAVLWATADEGVRSAARAAAALGRATVGLWERAATVVFALLGATRPLLRAVWEILEAAAPLLHAAGTAAAFCGILAILYSTFVFARARRIGPEAGLHGGTR